MRWGRSQVVIVDQDGAVQVNRYLPNEAGTVLRVIGDPR